MNATAQKYEPLDSELEITAATEAVALVMKKIPPPAEVIVKLADGVDVKCRAIG